MKKFNLVLGSQVVEESDSTINGKVSVIRSLAWGYYIQAGSDPGTLTQSGGVHLEVCKSTLKKIKKKRKKFSSALILGLGGGSAAKLIKKIWPEAVITGVEIDPVMVNMGMKYLGLNKLGVDIKIQDAIEFCKNSIKKKKKYGLIMVDVYIGDEVPNEFKTDEFIEMIKKLTVKDGLAIFNRLYYDEKRVESMKFGKKLEEYFANVETHFPAANVMFVCSN